VNIGLLGGKDTEVTVEGDKIILYVWGTEDASQCQ
jgi:hypothetical protein